mmetsp:Transcript_90382/g.260410  ORF Transcript_90382/g.260410 Transcript_90382/m.260410 type:complete len:215 (-) Transcript_90382:164-808(-)
MKFASTLVTTTLLASSAHGFTPALNAVGRNSMVLNAEKSTTTTRGDFLAQAASGMMMVVVGFPGMARAAKYGAIGAGPTGVLDPKDAIIDDEIFNSSNVQNALKAVKQYAAMVGEMKSSLASNSQVNLGPYLRKEFDFSKLRSSLNDLNSAFDEETQRGTDRLIRGIMQDLTELETANAQKEGIERSERRVANMNAKLDKLQTAFNDLLAFAAP